MQTGIYEIVCLQNCRRYIGSATSFSNRWARHKYQLRSGVHHSSYLQRAWNKHGENAFLFNVLIKCHKDDLILYEQIAIDALLPEFNCCRVAGNTAGRITSQETKAKLSAAITGIRRSEDTRQLMSFAAKGRHRAPLSQETKTKISLSLFGKPQPRSQEHSAALGRAKRLFDESNVREIHKAIAMGKTLTSIAKANNCSTALISLIKSGKSYSWIKS